MAPLQDVGKLRQVLDYMPCETCLDSYTPEQDYFCGICARLHREVVIKKNAVGSDEAVQVIPPEDFHLARDLRDRLQQQELELQEAKERFAKLQARESDLMQQLKDLQEELERAKKQKDEAALVPFRFVGIKGPRKPEEPLLEFGEEEPEDLVPESPDDIPPATPGEETPAQVSEWEEIPPDEPQTGETPQWEEVAPETETSTKAIDEEPMEMPGGPAQALPQQRALAQRRAAAADDAIARIEAEIGKIEQELTQLASEEKDLAKKSGSSVRKSTRRGRN